MSTKSVCGMSCGAMHEFALVLDKAGFDADLVQEIINSRGNKHAECMHTAVIGGMPVAKPKSILRLLTPGLIIPATDGAENLSDAKVFSGWVDPDLENWGCNIASEAKPETAVVVHELVENAVFQQIFDGQGVGLDQLCLTPHQIKKFVVVNREHLHPQGWATFFLFKVEGSFFVACVRWRDARRLGVHVRRFSRDYVWGADGRYRVVLPLLAL